jgi:hypothetical protein
MWRYYTEFGEAGGTTSLVYVDSVKGDDANPGTYLLPKKSMQAGFDLITGTGAVMVISGYFKEGAFLNLPTNVKIIAEGHCVIDCNGLVFLSTIAKNINDLSNNLTNVWDYGYLEIRNTPNIDTPASVNTSFYNCYLNNCFGFSSSTNAYVKFEKCLVKNGFTGSFAARANIVNCCFFGTEVGATTITCNFKNNYVHKDTKIKFGNIAAANYNYNFVEGTLTDHILINGVYYTNTEALKAARPTFAVNDLASTTNPQINALNPDDMTIKENSPLIGAGEGGVNIGAFDSSVGQGASDANWTLSNIDNTTTSGVALISTGAVGTLTTTVGIQLRADGSRRTVKRILLPSSIQDPEFGETINSQIGTDAGIPSMYSVEIQFSRDSGATYNGTWLKVPYGGLPLHDTVNNVGNADSGFVSGTKIKATHILLRITLRNNDV